MASTTPTPWEFEGDAADRLRVSDDLIRMGCQELRIGNYRDRDGKLFVMREDVNAWVEECRGQKRLAEAMGAVPEPSPAPMPWTTGRELSERLDDPRTPAELAAVLRARLSELGTSASVWAGQNHCDQDRVCALLRGDYDRFGPRFLSHLREALGFGPMPTSALRIRYDAKNLIRDIRKFTAKTGVSYAELSEEAGRSRSYVKCIVSGHNSVSRQGASDIRAAMRRLRAEGGLGDGPGKRECPAPLQVPEQKPRRSFWQRLFGR